MVLVLVPQGIIMREKEFREETNKGINTVLTTKMDN
jgi:hypothetical protein